MYVVAVRVQGWSQSDSEWNDTLSLLQPEEAARIRRFVHHIDAQRSAIGRLLLKYMIARELGTTTKDIGLGRTDKGRPFIVTPRTPEARALDVNVSHAGEWVVAACGRGGPIGIDIDCYDRPRASKDMVSFLRDFESIFTPSEWHCIRRQLPRGPEATLAQFASYWTLKESYVKALGEGIGYGLERINFQCERHKGDTRDDGSCYEPIPSLPHATLVPVRLILDDQDISDTWQFWQCAPAQHHIIAIAQHCGTVAREDTLDIRTITPSELLTAYRQQGMAEAANT